MSLTGAIAGAFAGTLVLTTALRAASELGVTRMDLPFLLGTMVTANRRRAQVIGYALHFAAGLGFAVIYFLLFSAIHRSGWVLGAVFGLVHVLFSATVLVNVLLPMIHPRMASFFTAADSSPFLEPPGFMMRNYGRRTPIVMVLAHVAYGAIVGGFISMAGPG
jgi:hypothetical protein